MKVTLPRGPQWFVENTSLPVNKGWIINPFLSELITQGKLMSIHAVVHILTISYGKAFHDPKTNFFKTFLAHFQ